jgi:DNA-binding transcriptional ArsR family regulator
MTSSLPVLDSSPAYDVVESLLVLGGRVSPGRWRAWAEQTRASLGAVAARRLRIWFGGDDPIGGAALALIPRLSGLRDGQELISALSALPQGDFLRLAVTAGSIAPEAPLTSDDLLSLCRAPVARVYIDRYLRLTGRARVHLRWILDEPKAACDELVEIIRRHLTGPFVEVERTIGDERERAAQRLGELLASDRAADPPWLRKVRDLDGFSPVVVAPSACVPRSNAYYHEVRQPLFDGTSYEPYVLVVNTRVILGLTQSGRPATDAPPRGQRASTHDLVERSATLFGLLADSTRLRMLRLLAMRPHYGQELASALAISGATTAHHTNELMKAGFVTLERRAHRTYFVLQTEPLSRELHERLDCLLAADQSALPAEPRAMVESALCP